VHIVGFLPVAGQSGTRSVYSRFTGPVVGIIGGGQLSRMTLPAAVPLGVRLRVLAASPDDAAVRAGAEARIGDHTSLDDLREFAAGCDVVTFDHEHVPGEHIRALEDAGVVVRPGAAALHYAQDKLAMRDRLTELGLPCPRYRPVATLADVRDFVKPNGWPVVLKAARGGYDGKGVWICRTAEEAAAVTERAPAEGVRLIAEEHVPFQRELAALVARSPHRQGAAYPVVETVQAGGVCQEVLAPAPELPGNRSSEAQWLALRIAAELGVTGLLAVEMFETSDGLLVNELAMRPHNSGHWTIEGARSSQFEQHLRAVLDLPLGSPQPAAPMAVMANVFGGSADDDYAAVYGRCEHVMAADPAAKLHLYGKDPRPGRKIGHVTVLSDTGTGGGRDWLDDLESLRDRARRAANYLRWGPEDAQ
jgi:5-(carboxyamino)imidazole ribonucleotide synthase